MSTYSSNLKIELIATGDQSGVWGTTTNSNFSNVFEQSIVGRVTVSFSNADVTLTATNTVASQDYRNVYLNCTGTNAASRNLIVPTLNKNYIVENNTTGGFSIVVKTSAGTGITIPNGSKCAVYVDGTNVVQNDNYFPAAVFASITDSGLTSGRVTFASTSGLLADSANLTWDGSFLTAASIKDTALTSGRVTFAGASGLLSDSANLTWNGTGLGIGGVSATVKLDILNSNATYSLSQKVFNANAGTFFLGQSPSATFLSVDNFAMAFCTNSDGGVAGTSVPTNERMRITSAGNVGIGTSSPAQLLHLNVTSGAVYELISSGSNNLYLGYENTRAVSVIQSNNALVFDVGSGYTERVRIDTSGNVSVGGFAPSAWSVGKAIEFNSIGNAVWGVSATQITMPQNAYFNGAWRYAANGLATRYAQESGIHQWWNAPNNTSGAGAALTFTQAMTLNDSGNLSLSITPSSFGSTYKAFQAGGYAAYVGDGNNGYAEILNNAYASNNNIFNYYDTNSAGRYSIQLGAHKWFSTGSGSANAQITWTQAMTLDTSGNLMVGFTSTSAIANKNIDVNGTGDAAFVIRVGGTTTSYLYSTAGQTLLGTVGAIPITFNTNGVEKVRITSGGVLDIGTGTGAVGQIQFPATAVPSANVNTLDDYEEGTWTAGIAFGGASVGVTYDLTPTCTYTKIGRQVTVTGRVGLSSKGSSTGDATITGLPFTPANTGNAGYGAAALAFGAGTTFSNVFQGVIVPNSTSIVLQQVTVAGTNSSLTDTNFSNSSNLLFTATYFV